jgi:translation initiation factor 2 alpha subunit (eIF-2alpha)
METEKAYQEKMDPRLKALAVKIDLLKARADKTNGEANIENYKQIKMVREKQELLRNRLHELKKSGDEAWEELRSGVYIAWDDLKYALNRALSRFKKRGNDALTSQFS